ncbi:MAG: polyphenol oxidase family protein [Oscillospiraceae bacterium]|nr:polyphenol oxidase family protein [Oscillospiraceae bacterium]
MRILTHFSEKLPSDPAERFSALEKQGFVPLYTLYQEHTDRVVEINTPFVPPVPEAMMSEQAHGDAIVTNQPGFFIGVKTADCVPILLWNERASVIGAVHAGWRGTALGIAEKAVAVMQDKFVAGKISAKIGACICPDCFVTHADVPDSMPEWANDYIRPAGGGRFKVDLPGINRLWLAKAGVGDIAGPECCTSCNHEIYWSHRQHGKERGLQINLIGILDDSPAF